MKAVWFDQPGDPACLKIIELEQPPMIEGGVRVDIYATAINRADLLQRRGAYPPPKGESEILGLEMAGIITQVGRGVTSLQVGDRICALLPGGGYAESVVVPAAMAAKIPDSMSFEQAAAIPEVFYTAYSNLMWLAHLTSEDTVLVHAGASGVGTAAIQIIKALGATCFVTVGSDRKRDACLALGADEAINYHQQDFADVVLAKTNQTGANIILDFIGAPYLEANLRALALDGRLVIIGTMGGSKTQINLGSLLAKRQQIIGTALRNRTLSEKIRLTQEFWAFATPRFEAKTLSPVVDRVFAFNEVVQAHEYMEKNQNIGKIVLRVR
nr:NAD(P)H-quinone oxidoreductase [Bacilli bacterium]